MSSPLLPTSSPLGSSTRTPSGTSREDLVAFISDLGAEGRTLAIGARIAGPPIDVLEQISGAAERHRQLRERGEELRFSALEPGTRLSIMFHDTAGGGAREVSAAEAFAIVAGDSAE